MSDDTADTHWMDEYESGVQPTVSCDVEIYVATGLTSREAIAKAAWGLRAIAVQLEAGRLDDGHHPVVTLEGDKIGTVYVDFSGLMSR